MRPFAPLTLFGLRTVVLVLAVLALRLPAAHTGLETRYQARIAAVSHATDAYLATAGGRVLLRVGPAPLLAKVPFSPFSLFSPLGGADLPLRADGLMADYAGPPRMQSVWAGAVLRVLRRIPRMDSGDPPRV